MISNLPTIIPAKRISSSEVLQGKVIPDIDRLLLFSPHDFEAMVLEWATEFLKGKYSDVKNIGGAGDKGRDVIGYYPDNSIDIYQCKHYKDPITPTIMYVELGKLCLYTFNKDYPTPKTYYVVSPKGCGGALSDLIDNPIELRKKLIDNWSIYCESKITSTGKVELKGAFRKHVEQFDFSIVKVMQPLTLISQYKETSHYPTRFGGGLVKYRSVLPKADENIDVRELVYTEQLLKVYSEKEATKISTVSELKTKSVDLEEHFNEQRNSF